MSIHTRLIYSDRGSETVETAVLAGLALVLLVSVVQAALWWHTRSLCQHAATTGLHAARTYNSTPGAGERAAADFLVRAPNAATDPVVAVHASAETVTVAVSANPPHIVPVPGLALRVTQSSTAERERFTTPGAAS